MGSFHRIDTTKLVKGAGRLMAAASTQAMPLTIGEIIKTDPAVGTAYDAQTGWSELGATREGIQVTINNTETGYDVDQIAGAIGTAPDTWSGALTTRLAERTLEHLQIAWEGGVITTTTITASVPNNVVAGTERRMGFAGATSYTERRLAVLFQRPNGKLEAWCVRRAVRAPQETSISFQKGGDPQTIAVQFNMLADSSVADPRDALGYVIEQT
jgi:hypothetical protein